MGSPGEKRVLCIYDKNVIMELNKIEYIKNRAQLVFELIQSYNLFNEMDVVQAVPATYEQLLEFHSSFYIDSIKEIETQQEEDLEEIGLTGDCPVLDDMYSFISHIAGSSLTAARGLLSGKYKLAINWCGGWHHSQRDMAEGFCYVNDIVLAILELCKRFQRILYIDLDVHHGNGVENAFSSTQKVFTFSLHRNGVGFYPNTGDLNDVGTGKGKYFTANVPLQSGTSDRSYLRAFHSVIKVIRESYRPQCLVVQCGADSLAKDELGDFNVSSEAFGDIISHLTSWSLPTLYLGGGGYNIYNTARYWTHLTSIITSTRISSDIPDECKHFLKYGPDFTLPITSSCRRDENSEEGLSSIIDTLVHNIANHVTSPFGKGELTCERNQGSKVSVDGVENGNFFDTRLDSVKEQDTCSQESEASSSNADGNAMSVESAVVCKVPHRSSSTLSTNQDSEENQTLLAPILSSKDLSAESDIQQGVDKVRSDQKSKMLLEDYEFVNEDTVKYSTGSATESRQLSPIIEIPIEGLNCIRKDTIATVRISHPKEEGSLLNVKFKSTQNEVHSEKLHSEPKAMRGEFDFADKDVEQMPLRSISKSSERMMDIEKETAKFTSDHQDCKVLDDKEVNSEIIDIHGGLNCGRTAKETGTETLEKENCPEGSS